MTIDQMIESLNKAKNDLGGEENLRLHVTCNGCADVLEIDDLSYSKFLGLKCDVKPPWWAYKGSER